MKRNEREDRAATFDWFHNTTRRRPEPCPWQRRVPDTGRSQRLYFYQRPELDSMRIWTVSHKKAQKGTKTFSHRLRVSKNLFATFRGSLWLSNELPQSPRTSQASRNPSPRKFSANN